MRIFGYEITREKKEKEVEFPPLFVSNRYGSYDTIETWQIAFHDTMYDMVPVKQVWNKSSWWTRLIFRYKLFRDPINTIRIIMGTHTKEFCEDINQRILEVKKGMM